MSFVNSEVFALENGLLNGKALDYKPGNSSTWQNGAITNVTDNNLNTSSDLVYNSKLSYTFSIPHTINAFAYYSTQGRPFYVNLYDDSGKRIGGGSRMVSGYNQIISLATPVSGVKRVEIDFDYGSNINVQEFDVFGQSELPAPSNLRSVPKTKAVELTWDYPVVNTLSHFNIYLNGQLFGTTTQKTFTVTNLQPEIINYFYVTAQHGNDESIPSGIRYESAYPEPFKPPELKANIFENRIHLYWDDVGQVSYKLLVNGILHSQGVQLYYEHNNLELNSTYNYQLILIDKFGREIVSPEYTFTTAPPPEPVPIDLKVKSFTHQKIEVQMKAIKNLILEINGLAYSTDKNSYIFNDLTPATEYEIKAYYTDIYGRLIEEFITVTTEDPPPPIAPQLKVSSVKTNSIRITWDAVGESYEVYQNGELVFTASRTFHDFYSLTAETTYEFQVIAIDKFERKNPSNVVTATTLQAPVPTVRPQPTKPPSVSDSGNVDLDEANDHLVAGANDTKKSFMSLIWIIIAILILIVGTLFLLRIFKRKMAKSAVSNAKNATAVTSTPGTTKPRTTNNMTYRTNRPSQIKNYNRTRRSNYYVKKRSFKG